MSILEIFALLVGLLLIICLLIWSVYGSFRAGRQMGGVYILYAPPSEGKSYVATHLIIEYLKKGRTTFSNFPVITPDKKYISCLWLKEFMKKNIFKSAIFIDESYKDYNSREYKTFSKDDHDWFATSGHNENSIWLLTQNPQRIDTIIREVANFYVFVEKVEIPLLDIPLYFRLYYYRSEEEMRVSKYGLSEPWDYQRIWFNWYTASSYQTTFFKKPATTIYKGKKWIDALKEKGFEYVSPVPSGIAWLKIIIYTRFDNIINYMTRKRNDGFFREERNKQDENVEKDKERKEIDENWSDEK